MPYHGNFWSSLVSEAERQLSDKQDSKKKSDKSQVSISENKGEPETRNSWPESNEFLLKQLRLEFDREMDRRKIIE